MQNFSVNSTIRFNSIEFQLRTSNNGQLNKIVCSLFRKGEFVNSKEVQYKSEYNDRLLEIINKFHEQRKSEFEQLFDLSKKLKAIGNPELHNMLGSIFNKNLLYNEAIREFSKAISYNASDPWAYNNIGKTLLLQNNYEDALKAFEKAIIIAPEFADLYNNLGLVYLEFGSCKEASDEFKRAVNLNPYYAEAFFNLGLTYVLNEIERNDFELANEYTDKVYKCFDKATLMNPSYQNKTYQKGIKYLKENKPELAITELRKAKGVGTQSSYLYDKYEYYLKLLFFADGNHFEMIWKYITFLQGLLKKYPGHADIYNDLGLGYCMLRNYLNEKAIDNFKHALEINPNFGKAQRNYKLSSYEKTGSEIFIKAITSKLHNNGNEFLEDEYQDEDKDKDWNLDIVEKKF